MLLRENLATVMHEKHMDRITLARASGVNNATVCRIVSGFIKDPKISNVKAIADALDVTVDRLLQ